MTKTFNAVKVLGVASQGAGGHDEKRLQTLIEPLGGKLLEWKRPRSLVARLLTVPKIVRTIGRARPDLVVLEGTGVALGLAVWAARRRYAIPYVLSSGDSVAPYLRARWGWLAGAVAQRYERMLYRNAAGFMGWTPYLVGRALTLGAPRAVTIPGWSALGSLPADRVATRIAAREKVGIPNEALVIGIVGSLAWNPRRKYAYGLEIVKALRVLQTRPTARPVYGLIIGDGDGLARLSTLASGLDNVRFTGRVPRDELMPLLQAMDLASLPQSMDEVGTFRYTTKLPEYLHAGLSVVTGPLPFAYDLDDGWIRMLHARFPWEEAYPRELAQLLQRCANEAILPPGERPAPALAHFDRATQIERASAFLSDVIAQTSR